MNARPCSLSTLEQDLPEHIDLFICSASFEERCLSIGKRLNVGRVGYAVVVRNRRFTDIVAENFDMLQRRFAGRCSELDVDSDDPVLTTSNMVETIAARRGSARYVVIDVTTFTHEALLILFRVCDEVLESGTVVDFVYSPAGEYSIGDEPGEKWLSKGIREVRSVMGFPGGFVPSRGTHLVILMGFEDYRAVRLIEELEPTLVSIGYGDSAEVGTGPHQATNEARAARIRNVLGSVEDFVFSCYDPLRTEQVIRRIVDGHLDYNTILAPMNTKLSTLGAGRVAREDESIQICYAQADTYNYRRYSSPGGGYYRCRFAGYPKGTTR